MHNFLLFTTAFASLFLATTAQFNPNDVSQSDRDTWCQNQVAACPLICTQETGGSAGTYANDCNPSNLAYDCICANGLSPNISEFSQTVPFYICQWTNNACVTNCGHDNTCAAACNDDHPCGAQNPTRTNSTAATTTSATSSATGDANSTVVYNGFGSSATASSSNGKTNAATNLVINVGQIYGLGVVMAGIFTGFTMFL